MAENLYSFENEIFANLVFYGTLVLIKVMIMTTLTSIKRVKTKSYISVEDVQAAAPNNPEKQKKMLQKNDEVERVRAFFTLMTTICVYLDWLIRKPGCFKCLGLPGGWAPSESWAPLFWLTIHKIRSHKIAKKLTPPPFPPHTLCPFGHWFGSFLLIKCRCPHLKN